MKSDMKIYNNDRFAYGIILALGVVYLYYQVSSLPATPVLEPDSATYLNFSAIRTAFYPLILKFLGPQLTMLFQPVLYAAAVTALSCYVFAVSRNIWAACIILIFCCLNPFLNKYHSHIMTESLYLSVLLVFVMMVIAFFRNPWWKTAALVSLSAGLLSTIRPTGYALFPVLVLMVLMIRTSLRGKLTAMLIGAILPMVIVISAERSYTNWVHGADATSLAGRHLFAKIAMIKLPMIDPNKVADPTERRLLVATEQDSAPIRDLLDQAPDLNTLSAMSIQYETCLEYSCMDSLRTSLGMSEAETNRLMLNFAIRHIISDPLDSLTQLMGLSWRNYYYMCTLYVYPTPDAYILDYPYTMSLLNSYLFSKYHNAYSDNQQKMGVPSDYYTYYTYWLTKPYREYLLSPKFNNIIGMIQAILCYSTEIIALMGLGIVFFAGRFMISDTLLKAGLVSALALHISLLFTAAVGVGTGRYLIGLWPLLGAALVFTGLWLFNIYQLRDLRKL